MPKVQKTVKKTETKKAIKKSETKTESKFSIKMYDLKGVEGSPIKLSEKIFSTTAKPELMAQYIRVYLANQRQGNASTLNRGEVTGSTRKIYRQKGTGKARHGDIRAPIFVGGGVVGGPRPKSFALKMNKQQKRKALFCALTIKYKNENIIGLQSGEMKIEPKTKIISDFLNKMQLNNKSVLFVLPKLEKNNFVLASRNISKVKLTDVFSLNPYELLKSHKIIFTDDSLAVLEKHFI